MKTCKLVLLPCPAPSGEGIGVPERGRGLRLELRRIDKRAADGSWYIRPSLGTGNGWPTSKGLFVEKWSLCTR